MNEQRLVHLSAGESRLAATLARPRLMAIACVVVLAGLGWSACGLMAARPGVTWLDAVCGPGAIGSAADLSLIVAMWAAMTLAMMLPSAGPMILTYAEIADTAARKHEPVVSPLVLTLGYVSVWFGFALVAAWTQIALVSAGVLGTGKIQALLSAAIFITAGLYQFSQLKTACLMLCQRPFPFFFANWTDRPRGVFLLGLRQGLYCLGCCWALMLLMFAVGSMNVLWMAALGALMTIEKMLTGQRFSRALGVALMIIGFALAISEFM
jgi:predicted metal-binding membrane protein